MDDKNAKPRPGNLRPFTITVNCDPASGQVQVHAPMMMKPACIKALAAAMQVIVDYELPLVLAPNGNGTH